MTRSWRDIARPIVAAVLRDTEGQDEKAIRKAIFDAYPFGARRYLPYKVWLDEVKRQRRDRRSYGEVLADMPLFGGKAE